MKRLLLTASLATLACLMQSGAHAQVWVGTPLGNVVVGRPGQGGWQGAPYPGYAPYANWQGAPYPGYAPYYGAGTYTYGSGYAGYAPLAYPRYYWKSPNTYYYGPRGGRNRWNRSFYMWGF